MKLSQLDKSLTMHDRVQLLEAAMVGPIDTQLEIDPSKLGPTKNVKDVVQDRLLFVFKYQNQLKQEAEDGMYKYLFTEQASLQNPMRAFFTFENNSSNPPQYRIFGVSSNIIDLIVRSSFYNHDVSYDDIMKIDYQNPALKGIAFENAFYSILQKSMLFEGSLKIFSVDEEKVFYYLSAMIFLDSPLFFSN